MLGNIEDILFYYSKSIFNLFSHFNWWVFPLVFFKKPVIVETKNKFKFYVSNLMDIWTIKETIIDNQYHYQKIGKRNKVVIDIGAGIGDFSILAAKKSQKVIAYECDEERVDLMKKNLILNKIDNVVIYKKKANSLEEILKEVATCNFLKIDCEGCEYKLFKNISCKQLAKVNYLAMEIHFFNEKMKKEAIKLINTLKINNFKIKIFPNKVHKSQLNYLFGERSSSFKI